MLPGTEHLTRGHLPGIDLVLLEGVEFGPRIGHAGLNRRAHLRAEFLRVEVAAGANSEGGEPVPQGLLRGQDGGESQGEVEDLEKLRRGLLLISGKRRDPVNRWRRRWGGLVEKGRQRLNLVLALDLGDVVEVVRAEQLGAVQHKIQVGFRANHLVDTGGLIARPTRSCQQVIATCVTGRSGSDIVEVVGVSVDELQRVEPVVIDRRDRQHQRLSPKIRT